jgi:hypothetical protein
MSQPVSKLVLVSLVVLAVAASIFAMLSDAADGSDPLSITADYGIADCNLKMKVSELGEGWSEPIPFSDIIPTDIMGFLRNPERGIGIKYHKDKIILICFLYDDDRYATFAGSTREDVGMQSSPEEVIRTYGKPSEDFESVTDSGNRNRDLYYEHLGISFEFVNESLSEICVHHRNRDLDKLYQEVLAEAKARRQESEKKGGE